MDLHEKDDIIAVQQSIVEKLEELSLALLGHLERSRVYGMRDLLLFKLIIAEMMDGESNAKVRLHQKLDEILLYIGDDDAVCKAVAQAHEIIDSK